MEYVNVTLRALNPEGGICNESTDWDYIEVPTIKTGGCSCCSEERAMSDFSNQELQAIADNLMDAWAVLIGEITDREHGAGLAARNCPDCDLQPCVRCAKAIMGKR